MKQLVYVLGWLSTMIPALVLLVLAKIVSVFVWCVSQICHGFIVSGIWLCERKDALEIWRDK